MMESLEGRTLMSASLPVAPAIIASDEYYVAGVNRRGAAQLSTRAGGEVVTSALELENTLVSGFKAPVPPPQGIIAVLIG